MDRLTHQFPSGSPPAAPHRFRLAPFDEKTLVDMLSGGIDFTPNVNLDTDNPVVRFWDRGSNPPRLRADTTARRCATVATLRNGRRSRHGRTARKMLRSRWAKAEFARAVRSETAVAER